MFAYNFSYSQTLELECLKEINYSIKQHIISNIDSKKGFKYDSSAVFIIQLEVLNDGSLKSIVVKKDNLCKYGVKAKNVVKYLKRQKFPCMYKVYYSETIKPSKVYFVFNDKLSVKSN